MSMPMATIPAQHPAFVILLLRLRIIFFRLQNFVDCVCGNPWLRQHYINHASFNHLLNRRYVKNEGQKKECTTEAPILPPGDWEDIIMIVLQFAPQLCSTSSLVSLSCQSQRFCFAFYSTTTHNSFGRLLQLFNFDFSSPSWRQCSLTDLNTHCE